MEELDESKIESVADSLNKAISGIGTDEDMIINQITASTIEERQLVKKKYLSLYGALLEEELESELSGHFRECAVALFKNPFDYQAEFVKKACDGLGTNERILIEILCTKDAAEINKLKAAYKHLYRQDLDSVLKSEQGGDLGRLFRAIASGGRASNHGYDPEIVKKEAHELYDAGQGKIGTDEAVFIKILCSRSFAQLNATFAVYKELFKSDFETVLKKELSGDLYQACYTIYACATNKPLYFAKMLKETIRGLGTKDTSLIRFLVSRAHIDLRDICIAYKGFYKKSLESDIKSDTSGDYRKLLLSLIAKYEH